MYLSDEQITTLLIEYATDDRYQQAVLIDGDWGSGKTYYIQETLLPRLKDYFEANPDLKRSVFYISLYGKENFSQIMDEIYAASLEDYFDEKFGDGKGEKIHRGMNFAVKLLSTGLKYFNIDTADLPKPSEFKKLKNAVLIFDDLERCNIDVNQLFGFINSLVEHNSIKVIIVANQIEIGKVKMLQDLPQKYSIVLNNWLKFLPENNSATKNNDTVIDKEELLKYTEQIFSEDVLYEKVKEKLIGLTIYYRADLKKIYNSIITKYVVNQSVREYLNSQKQIILTIFENKQHYNIRTLIFAIMALDKLLEVVDKIDFQPQKYIDIQKKQIINYVVELSIHLKMGNKPYSWNNSTAQSGMVNLNSDPRNLWGNSIYGYKFVDEYLLNRFLMETNIQSLLLSLMIEQKSIDEHKAFENALKYNLLYSWWELEDSEIEQLLKDILQELSELKYHPRYFKNMIITLMQLKTYGFSGIDYKQYVDLMKLRLEQKEDEFKSEGLHVLSDDKAFVAEYMKIAQPLILVMENKEREAKEAINESLQIDKSWGDVFYKKCCDNRQNYLSDKKFFFYLEPEKIIRCIKDSSVKDLYSLLNGINEVYNFSNLNDFFKADIEHITETIEKLDIEQLSEGKITKKIVLTKLRDKLQESLKLIEKNI